MITIINLPEKCSYLSYEAVEIIKAADMVFVQSAKTGAKNCIEEVSSNITYLDDFYDKTEDFESLKSTISDYIISSAYDKKVFLCMGGNCGNGIVDAIKSKTDVYILPSVNMGDECLCFAQQHFNCDIVLRACVSDIGKLHLSGSEGVLITNISSAYELYDVKLFLSDLCESTDVAVLSASDKIICNVNEIDRFSQIGNETCVFMPAVPYEKREFNTFYDLVQIMDRLRAKDGCPWDIEQTHKSIAVNAVEEAYEVADAINREDTDALYDELGDLLLQVVFHAKIAKDHNEFELKDVFTSVCKKLIRRHPHIFADVKAETSDKVLYNWEQIKRGEKGIENTTQSLMDVPAGMSALIRTQKIQKKASQVGLDFSDAASALERLREEIEEFENAHTPDDIATEAGDMLFSVCNVIRKSGLSAETVLMNANDKFISRVKYMEKTSEKSLNELSGEELDALWEKSKENTL